MIKNCKVTLEVKALKVGFNDDPVSHKELEEFVSGYYTVDPRRLFESYRTLRHKTDKGLIRIDPGEWILKFMNGEICVADLVGDSRDVEKAPELFDELPPSDPESPAGETPQPEVNDGTCLHFTYNPKMTYEPRQSRGLEGELITATAALSDLLHLLTQPQLSPVHVRKTVITNEGGYLTPLEQKVEEARLSLCFLTDEIQNVLANEEYL